VFSVAVPLGLSVTVDAGPDERSAPLADGAACPLLTSSYQPEPFTAPHAHQGVCSSTDVQAFIAACIDSMSTTASCEAWASANVASEPDSGTPCGNCILAPSNNGGVWLDPFDVMDPNYAGCIALAATSGGSACGASLNATIGCEAACDFCSTQSDYSSCANSVDQDRCKTFVATESTACVAELQDGGQGSACFLGESSGNIDIDYATIIELICGGGGDGGT
jgi:hypothetical protein